MTPEQKAAFVNAQTALLLAEIEGMKAENRHRIDCGHSIAHGDDEFAALIKSYEHLGYNNLIEFFAD